MKEAQAVQARDGRGGLGKVEQRHLLPKQP
jgi:hypothetical protein